jgi:tetratricopeptide (TPR) repeat protein
MPKNIKSNAAKSSVILPHWIFLLLLGVLTYFVYSNTFEFDFVYWDDSVNVFENKNIQSLDWVHIKQIFTTDVIGNYNPLTILGFAIQYHFFYDSTTEVLNPHGFHVVNVVIHLINVFLVFEILKRLKFPVWIAFFGALLFSIHPMKVESVAWVTELKDVLFGFFFLAVVFLYLRWNCKPSLLQSLILTLLFICSLLSKIQAVALPVTLILIDVLVAKKFYWKSVFSKWYMFLLSLGTGLLGVYMLSGNGSLEKATAKYTVIERLCIASHSLLNYVIKFFYSYENCAIYPYETKLSIQYVIAGVLILLAVLAFIYFIKKMPLPVSLGFLIFFVNVVFLLQFVGAGQGLRADRFSYIPYFGLIISLCYIIELYKSKLFVVGIFVVMMLIHVKKTYAQVMVWENSISLWENEIIYYPNQVTSYQNLANFYRDNKDVPNAIKYYDLALENKKDATVYNGKGKLLYDNGKYAESLQNFNMATSIDSNLAEAWINRGGAYFYTGKTDSALVCLNIGLRKDPNFKNGFKNRAVILMSLGLGDFAMRDFDRAIELGVNDPNVNYENANLYAKKGDIKKSNELLEYSIQFENQHTYLYYELLASNAQKLGDVAAYQKYTAEAAGRRKRK